MDETKVTERYRVIIADDDPIFRSALRLIVQQTCEVVAEAENGQAAIDAAEALHPDIVFLDISMPILDGFQAAAKFRANLSSIRIVMVTSHSEKAFIEQALRSGAQAYVVKGSALVQVPDAIRGSWRADVPGRPASSIRFSSCSVTCRSKLRNIT